MKKIIKLTESELINLIKSVIKEEKYSEEDLTYVHPYSGKECKIKIARNKLTDRKFSEYGAVLVCDVYDNGNEMVIAEIPGTGSDPQYVNDLICNNIEKVMSFLDHIFEGEKEYISEDVNSRRWDVIEDPVVCRSDKYFNEE